MDLFDSTQRKVLNARIKYWIGPLIGRPYKRDDYLDFANTWLGSHSDAFVVDVGCNVGTTVLPLALRWRQARFLAIEAHPGTAARMAANIQLNRAGNVDLLAGAISDASGVAKIYAYSANSGGTRLSPHANPGTGDQELFVPVVPLRAAMAATGVSRCDLLKIDVEGFELQVLRSLGDWLQPARFSAIVCEYGPEGTRSAGYTPKDLIELANRSGYQIHDLHSGRAVRQAGDLPELRDFLVTDLVLAGA